MLLLQVWLLFVDALSLFEGACMNLCNLSVLIVHSDGRLQRLLTTFNLRQLNNLVAIHLASC